MQRTGTIFVPIEYCPINPLSAELNPICYLLALLGAHHFLHFSRIRVNLPDILIETFCGFPSVSTVQYLQESIHINHCLLRIYVRFAPSQRATFYEVQGSSPRCFSRFLTSDSTRY